jgi:hypothetical protein
LESDEIKKLKPIYNRAQRRNIWNFALFTYTDHQGYIRFSIGKTEGENPPVCTFTSKREGATYWPTGFSSTNCAQNSPAFTSQEEPVFIVASVNAEVLVLERRVLTITISGLSCYWIDLNMNTMIF